MARFGATGCRRSLLRHEALATLALRQRLHQPAVCPPLPRDRRSPAVGPAPAPVAHVAPPTLSRHGPRHPSRARAARPMRSRAPPSAPSSLTDTRGARTSSRSPCGPARSGCGDASAPWVAPRVVASYYRLSIGASRPPPGARQSQVQTASEQTLLVNSKTPWMATLHRTVEGQRDRGCWVKQCSPMFLEMRWPRLNQQSQNIVTSVRN
jgi:hypothetical protein